MFYLFSHVCVDNDKSGEHELKVREKRSLDVLLRNPAVITAAKAAMMASFGAASSFMMLNDVDLRPNTSSRKVPNLAISIRSGCWRE